MPWPLDLTPSEPPPLGVGATLACGVLLGFAICLVETVQQPIAVVEFAAIVAFLRRQVPLWSICGMTWTLVARWAEPRMGAGALAIPGLAATLVSTALLVALDRPAPIAGTPRDLPLEDFVVHVLWTNAFYGGLYLAAYAGWRRFVRSRRALARVRQAREESAALLQEMRVESFRRALQPRTVMACVDALRRLYRQDPARGDALVDELVGFLRPAVRSLGAPTASLATELDLAVRYLRLRALCADNVGDVLAGAPTSWPQIAFPAGLLTPVVERLCLGGGRVSLQAGTTEHGFRIVIGAQAVDEQVLAVPLRRRMAALDAAPGCSSRILAAGGDLVWVIRVHPHAAEASSVLIPGATA
jgi:hypothetical protein